MQKLPKWDEGSVKSFITIFPVLLVSCPVRARRHQIFLKCGVAYRISTSETDSQMFLIPSIALSDFALQI